jgi:hypothetical protein
MSQKTKFLFGAAVLLSCALSSYSFADSFGGGGGDPYVNGTYIDCSSVKKNANDPFPSSSTSFSMEYMLNAGTSNFFSIFALSGDSPSLFAGLNIPDPTGLYKETGTLDLWDGEAPNPSLTLAPLPPGVFIIKKQLPSEIDLEISGGYLGGSLQIQVGKEQNYVSPVTLTSPIHWQGFCSIGVNFKTGQPFGQQN